MVDLSQLIQIRFQNIDGVNSLTGIYEKLEPSCDIIWSPSIYDNCICRVQTRV